MMEELEGKKIAFENGIEYVVNTNIHIVPSKQNMITLFFKAIKDFLFRNTSYYQKI